MKRALLFTTLLTSLAGCSAVDPGLTFLAGESSSQPWELSQRYYSGSYADVAVQTLTVVRSQQEWEQLWAQLHEKMPHDLPAGKMAVAVLAGQKPTTGYRVEIVSVERSTKLGEVDKLVVQWRLYRPNEDTMQAQTLTSPWALQIVNMWPYAPDFQELSTETIRTY